MSAENYPLIREPRSLDYSSINATAVGETDKATRNANDDSKCCNKFTKAYLDVPFVARDCFPCVFSPKEYFMNKLPVLQTVFMKYWQKRYVKSVSFFVADLIAGLTVGLMLVPQALAYAKIAGLSPEVSFNMPLSIKLCACHQKTLLFAVVWTVFIVHGLLCVFPFWYIQRYYFGANCHHVIDCCFVGVTASQSSSLCCCTFSFGWDNTVFDGNT